MENQQLLTLQEAARKLGVKPVTLRKWDREGKLKAIRIGSRGDRRYKTEDLENFVHGSQNKLAWQEYIRSGITWHLLDPIVRCITSGLKKHFGIGANYMMCYFEGDTLYWYYESNDLYDLGSGIIDQLLASKEFEDRFFKIWDQKSQEVLDLIKSNSTGRWKDKSNQDLAKLYKKYAELILEWYNVSISIDATDESLMIDITRKIKEILKDKLGEEYSESQFAKIYSILTTPSHLSFLNREKELILLLARDVHERKISKEDLEFKKRTKEIIREFWWNGLGWTRGKAKTIKDILKNIQEFEKAKIDYDLELSKIKNYSQKIAEDKTLLDRKYHFNKDKQLSEWLRIFDRLVDYHDFRKEVQMKSNFWEYQLLDEIAKRTNVSTKFLDWAEIDEIVDLLENGKIEEEKLNVRSSRFLYLMYQGKESKYSGKSAEKKRAEILGAEIEETRDLQGISASPGKVVGKAYVAITVKSALEIPKGRILVTGMTTPDFAPAMKKATAIVTDEGGITCHAAIVSRELGIPCIVGTKYSTRLIKDGDIIEVAANHGTVRILEKGATMKSSINSKPFEWILIQERGDNISLNPAIQPLFERYTASPKLILGVENINALLVLNRGGGKFFSDQKEWDFICNAALKKVKQDPDFVEKLQKKFINKLPRLDKIDKKIEQSELKNLSNQDLWKLYDEYFKGYKDVYIWSEPFCVWISQPLTDYLDSYLRKILASRHQEKLFSEYFEILISPSQIPFTTKEERALLDIALQVEKDSVLSRIFKKKNVAGIESQLEDFSNVNQAINNHQKKFEWVPFDYGNPVWDKQHFIQVIKDIILAKFNIDRRIRNIDNFYNDIVVKQEEIFAKLEIDSYHIKMFKALQATANLIDYKKERFTQSHFIAQNIIKEIGRRYEISSDYQRRLSHQDIKNILINEEKPDLTILAERWEQTVMLVHDDMLDMMIGKEGEEFLDKNGLSKKKLAESKETKGITASGGRVVGRARIIISPKDFGKMENGDVLITYMTTPDYVPVMRKASAIVTNEGGITCHAAIVSREMNIPCVVGTKNATDIFKDGDKIEVRANHGIVRKI